MADSTNNITCQQLVEMVSDYLERALATHDAELFEQHINYCDGCERYLDSMRRTIGIEGRLREAEVPEQTVEQLLRQFREERR